MDDFGYTNEEIMKINRKTDEETVFHLQKEKDQVEHELNLLKNDNIAKNYLKIYHDYAHVPGITFEELIKGHGHSAVGVMFYIVYIVYDALIEKKSEKEILAKNQNDYHTAIVEMRKELDRYFARKTEFEKNDILKPLMAERKWTYEYMMETFPELKTKDYLKDTENAIYLLQNIGDEALYGRYLELVGEVDTTLNTFDNSKSREKKKYLKDKIAEFERYEKILVTDEMNELFT